MKILIKDKKQEQFDMSFENVEYRQYLELFELCKDNHLILSIDFSETEEE